MTSTDDSAVEPSPLALPNEVWTDIIAYSLNYPAQNNLRNVCNKLASIVQRIKPLKLKVDLGKYINLNSEARVDLQMEYLMVQCRCNITEIVIPMPSKNNDDVIQVLIALANTQAHVLVSLQQKFGAGYCHQFDDSLSQLVNRCINLNVLEMAGSRSLMLMADLSHLKKLMVLKGCRLQFRNCTSNLVELNYQNVQFNGGTDVDDFQQMILAAASTLEVLVLKGFSIMFRSFATLPRLVQCSMPRLVQLTMSDNHGHSGISVNIPDSVNMKIFADSRWLRIDGFRVGDHSLDRLDLGSSNPTRCLTERAVDIEAFRSLKHLRLHNIDFESLNVMLARLETVPSHALRHLSIELSTEPIVAAANFDKLCNLLIRAENLNYFSCSRNIGQEKLTTLILAKYQLPFEIEFKFSHVLSQSEATSFMRNLISVLSSAMPVVIRRLNRFMITMRPVCIDNTSRSGSDASMATLQNDYNIVLNEALF